MKLRLLRELTDFQILQFVVKHLQSAAANCTEDSFGDTVWQSIKNLSFEGSFGALKAREDNQYVYAGGAEGFAGILLIRSSDKGENWDDLFPFCMVMDLDFYGDSIHKIIVTDHFKIMLSIDSGTSWSEIFRTDSLGIQNIAFSADGKRIYAVTNTMIYGLPRTYFFFSLDEGKNWTSMQLPIYDIITDMDLDFNDDIYLASISSGVFRLKSPVVSVKDETKHFTPKEFILCQNYPNPFNPTTKIKFTIPTSPLNPSPYQGEGNRERLLTLKVFDVLGNEVTTLVNDYKPAGNYELEFDGSKLTSGIYYYQLRIGEFIHNNNSPNRIFTNNNGVISTTPAWESSDLSQYANSLYTGDLNGDGFLDLAVSDNNQLGGLGRFKIYLNNNGNLNTTPFWTSSFSGYGSGITLADIDNDLT